LSESLLLLLLCCGCLLLLGSLLVLSPHCADRSAGSCARARIVGHDLAEDSAARSTAHDLALRSGARRRRLRCGRRSGGIEARLTLRPGVTFTLVLLLLLRCLALRRVDDELLLTEARADEARNSQDCDPPDS